VKTKNLAFVALAVLLIGVMWYRVVYSSMASEASKANKAAQEAEASAEALERQLASEIGGKGSKKPSNEELERAIPADAQLAEFLRSVNRIREQVGVPDAFQSLVPSPPTVTGGVASISVAINVTGTYAQMREYVDRLNSLSRLVVVDNVNVTAGAAAGESGSTAGGPVGDVFAGQGSAPLLTVQLATRLFTQASAAAPTGSAGSPAPSAGAGSGTGVRSAPPPGAGAQRG
jgi:Tfp pilus assembly protein PilO